MNSKLTASSGDLKLQPNPNADEYVPALSRSSAGGSARRKEPLVIKDQKSDNAFHQRLKESRDFWNLEEIPSYKKLNCATCILNKNPKNYDELLKELTHDVINFIAYYHECKDKNKEYECKYCVDEFNGVKDEEAEKYACPSECECDYCYGIFGNGKEEDYFYECDDKEDKHDIDLEKREMMKLERKREKANKKRNST